MSVNKLPQNISFSSDTDLWAWQRNSHFHEH